MRAYWMQWVFFGLGLVGLGCDETETIIIGGCGNDENTAEAGAPFMVADGGEVCGPDDIVVTALPSVSAGDLLMMCTHCDAGYCAQLGDPCPSYGMPCDFAGMASVCVGCCNGETGELHCAKP